MKNIIQSIINQAPGDRLSSMFSDFIMRPNGTPCELLCVTAETDGQFSGSKEVVIAVFTVNGSAVVSDDMSSITYSDAANAYAFAHDELRLVKDIMDGIAIDHPEVSQGCCQLSEIIAQAILDCDTYLSKSKAAGAS